MKKVSFLGHSHSVRTSLLVSYLVVLITPVLISLIVFFNNYRITREQTSQVFSVTNKHLTSLINTHVSEIRNESLALILNDYSQNLMNYRSSTPTVSQITQLRNLQKEMMYKITVSNYIEGMYAIFPRSDVILSDHGVFYNHNFSYKCRSGLGMTLEEWDNFMIFDGDSRVSLLKSTLDSGERILIAQKNRNTSTESSEMIVITVLNISVFQAILDELSQDGQSLVIIHDQNSGNSLLSSPIPAKLSYQVEAGNIVSDNAFVSSQDTDFRNWTCASVTPKATYQATMSPFVLSIIVYLFTCLSTGIVLIGYLSQKQSSSVQKILTQVFEAAELNPLSSKQNEYEQIQQAIQSLLYQRTSMKEENSLMRKSFQEHVLRNILSGRIKKDSIIYRHAHNNGISFHSNRFSVILYDIEDFGKPLSHIDAGTDNDNDEFLSSILNVVVCTAIQDAAQSLYTRYAVEIDERIACIVCCPEQVDLKQTTNDILRDADLVCSFLRNKFGLVLSTAISCIHNDMENISLCYQETLNTLDYMETMGMTSQICLYSQIFNDPMAPSVPLNGIFEKELLFCNCIKARDFSTSRNLLEEIIRHFHLEDCSAAEARLRMYGLIGAIRPILEDAQTELEGFPDPINPESLLQTKDVNVLCAQIMQILDRLIDISARQKSEKNSRQKDQFTQYIATHLTDPNLNVTIASDSFNMSPSYFSRTFKKATGVGVLDYIHQHRVDMAKKLIRQFPSMPLKDIAERVGYTTSLALNRAFRTYEGITPSVFREQFLG